MVRWTTAKEHWPKGQPPNRSFSRPFSIDSQCKTPKWSDGQQAQQQRLQPNHQTGHSQGHSPLIPSANGQNGQIDICPQSVHNTTHNNIGPSNNNIACTTHNKHTIFQANLHTNSTNNRPKNMDLNIFHIARTCVSITPNKHTTFQAIPSRIP